MLSGGGSRGLAHQGVLNALADAGVPIDVVGGTSQVRWRAWDCDAKAYCAVAREGVGASIGLTGASRVTAAALRASVRWCSARTWFEGALGSSSLPHSSPTNPPIHAPIPFPRTGRLHGRAVRAEPAPLGYGGCSAAICHRNGIRAEAAHGPHPAHHFRCVRCCGVVAWGLCWVTA